jgi:SNF family Na+-dependent transporter
VFAFGLDPAAGPELVFVTLPQIFLAMPFGRLFGSLFFLLLIAAALTSMIRCSKRPSPWQYGFWGCPAGARPWQWAS